MGKALDRGFLHLTPNGWERCDGQPFPQDRLETWAYEMGAANDDLREEVSLTRTWICSRISEEGRAAFHACYGQPLHASVTRSIRFACEV
jgi:hypothetical protein